MKAFVITLKDNKYSEASASACIVTASHYGLTVEKFYGINKDMAYQVMKERDLVWTWASMNTKQITCKHTGLMMSPYSAANLEPIIGCAMSHYSLWEKCIKLDEPIVILEHDAMFINTFPHDADFNGICQINDPRGATRKAGLWYDRVVKRNVEGVSPKTMVTTPEEKRPDGLAGNSAYMIKPWAAKELINKVKEIGVWPNDATMCQQLFPYLEEYYPFITKVIQGQSTTTS